MGGQLCANANRERTQDTRTVEKIQYKVELLVVSFYTTITKSKANQTLTDEHCRRGEEKKRNKSHDYEILNGNGSMRPLQGRRAMIGRRRKRVD